MSVCNNNSNSNPFPKYFPMNIRDYQKTTTDTNGNTTVNNPIQICGEINNMLGEQEGQNNPDCNFQFSYKPSTAICTHYENYLSFSYDRYNNMAPVLFNNNYYNVQEIRIYSPGLHTYGVSTSNNIISSNPPTQAELIIIHECVNTSIVPNKLLICVPMYNSTVVGGNIQLVYTNQSSRKEQLLDDIISSAKIMVPNPGEGPTQLDAEFNLNYFVPNDTYFYYQSPVTWDSCETNYDIIVMPNKRGFIPLSDTSYSTLTGRIPVSGGNGGNVPNADGMLQASSSNNIPYVIPDTNPITPYYYYLGGNSKYWDNNTPMIKVFPNQKYNLNVDDTTESFISNNFNTIDNIAYMPIKKQQISIFEIALITIGASSVLYFLYEITKDIRNKNK